MRQLHTQLRRQGPSVFRLAAILLCSLWLVLSPGASSGQTPGGALSFDGVSDYIQVPDAASLDISATVSVEMWVQTTTTANSVLLEKSNNNTNYGLQLAGAPNAGHLLFLISPNAATGQLMSNGIVNDGQWHHVAGTYNQATHTMNVYIDGVLDNTSTTITDAITLNTQPLLIGSQSGTLAFAGQMDEIRIWNLALCAGEIQNNKNCEVQAGTSGLVAVYHLDEGIAGGNNTGETVPGTPAITTVTPGDGQATVAFTAPASNGGSPITQYTVTSSPGGFTASGSASPITVSGLTDGTTYTFNVTATNAIGTGVASASSATVMPTGVPGAPAITSVASASSGDATVSFSPPASNGGLTITQYTVTSSPVGITATGTSSPITVTGLTNGQSYTFTMTATNADGTSASSASSVTPVTPTGVPGAPTITSATPGNASATVTFSPPSSNGGLTITGYTVTSSPGGFTGSGTSSPITVSGLTNGFNGTPYTFTVVATNAAGSSAPSVASSSVIPATIPGAPTAVHATASMGALLVSFTPPASNGGSVIEYYTVTTSTGLVGAGTNSPIWVTGLTNGVAVTVTVVATNAVGNSVPSAPASGTPSASVPNTKISITSATAGNGQVSVAFTGKPVTATGVVVFVSNSGAFTVPGGQFATGTTSPIVITGLTNGQTYFATAYYTVTAGDSLPSTSAGSGLFTPSP